MSVQRREYKTSLVPLKKPWFGQRSIILNELDQQMNELGKNGWEYLDKLTDCSYYDLGAVTHKIEILLSKSTTGQSWKYALLQMPQYTKHEATQHEDELAKHGLTQPESDTDQPDKGWVWETASQGAASDIMQELTEHEKSLDTLGRDGWEYIDKLEVPGSRAAAVLIFKKAA